MSGSGNGDDRDDRSEPAAEQESATANGLEGSRLEERDRADGSASSAADRPTVDDGGATTASSPGHGPGSDPAPSAPSTPSAPDDETVRNWTVLTAVLALVSVLTAGTIAVVDGAPMAVAGAIALAVGFGTIGLAGRTRFPAVFRSLHDAWVEHRPHVWVSTGLFAVGIAVGVALYANGVDLSELFLELLEEEFGGGELPGDGGGGLADDGALDLSATFFIANNTPPFLAAMLGGLTLGLATLAIMVFNGVIVGNVAAVTGADAGFGVILALLAPHGVFELPALFLAAGVGFRFLHRAAQRLFGSRDALFTKGYLVRTTALVVFGWLLLVLAAFVEAYVTVAIVEALFGSQA